MQASNIKKFYSSQVEITLLYRVEVDVDVEVKVKVAVEYLLIIYEHCPSYYSL